MSDPMAEDELDVLLAKLEYSVHNRQITEKDWSTQVYFDITNEFKQAINVYTTNKIMAELEDVLTIPSKYIDDGTMVYWADFQADTLEKIIRERIKALEDKLGDK
jgi:hypothetical protein